MQPRRRSVSARDGLRLSALEWEGSADRVPLLCLSGIARSAIDFAHVAERYRGERKVVALDYAGHGESGRADAASRYAPETALRDVLDAMAALHLHRVAILGTSFGGILGMALSVVRPGVLAGLALNDTGPRLEPVGLDFVRDFIGRDPAFASLDDAVAFLRRTLPPLGIPEHGWPDLAGRTYRQGKDGRWHPRWDTRVADALPRAGNGATELWPLFGAVPAVPLLLIWGQESAVLSAETVWRMQQARPDMAVASLPGIGHAPTLMEPMALQALDRMLATIA
jgi:pimeloyl-ACP methyl ester carboxylesterase